MAAGVKKVFQTANRVNNLLVPQFENLKQRKLGKSAYSVYVDYKAVFVDFIKGVKDRPLKSATQFAFLGVAYGVFRCNPDDRTYRDLLISNSLELLQLSSRIRNPASDAYTQKILQLHSEGRIKRQSLGLFSVMLVDDFNKDSDIYEKHCYYTKPRWLYLWKQVIDVGVMGHWIALEKCMGDFDINSEDLTDLPDDVEEGFAVNKAKRIGAVLMVSMEDCFYSIKQRCANLFSSES